MALTVHPPLHEKAGKRIASLIGCEAAMVSAGACSAMTLGTAAVLTGKNEDFIRRIPDLSGMKDDEIDPLVRRIEEVLS